MTRLATLVVSVLLPALRQPKACGASLLRATLLRGGTVRSRILPVLLSLLLFVLAALPASGSPATALRPGWGYVAYSNWSCDYFIIADESGTYSLLEWFGGLQPDTGDWVFGEFQRYGFQDLISWPAEAEVRVWVEDYWLSLDNIVRQYLAKCSGAPAIPPPLSSAAPLPRVDLQGAILIGADGQFLGLVSNNRFASDSICNQFGSYGSQFSSTSVRNQFSQYGSPFSHLSAYNEFTSSPPSIIKDRQRIGYLTKNRFLSGAVDPDVLFVSLDCVYR